MAVPTGVLIEPDDGPEGDERAGIELATSGLQTARMPVFPRLTVPDSFQRQVITGAVDAPAAAPGESVSRPH